MKRIFKKLLFLALLAISVNVYSQRILDIYSSGNIVRKTITSDIDSIKFVEAEYIVTDSGTTGACTWKIIGIVGMAGNYTLTISGKGFMGDYSSNTNTPWYQYRANIKTLIIEDGVVNIGNYAFSNCSYLNKVTIGSSVVIIGNYSFYYCINLTGVTIPGSVITIGNNAFYYCSSLTDITIPSSVVTVGNNAFYLCSSLTSINVDPANPVYSSTDGVLFNKVQTTLITYPAGKIGSYNIPNSVTTISAYAFGNCDSLTSVTIPSSVSTIGNYAFVICNNLTSIDVDAANTMYASIDGVLFNKAQTTLITYPAGKTGSYAVPNSVTVVYSGAFDNCEGLTSITIPNSVTTIGDFAFEACSSLTDITIPDSVTTIGLAVFQSCGSLNSVVIPNSVITIGNQAFMYCRSLTDITIPNSVTTIGNYAFYGCYSLADATIGNSVTTIGSYAFYDCYNLADVTIGSSVTSISNYAFSWCTGLTTVTNLNPTPQSINSNVFSSVTLSNCTLKVPAEAVSAYQAAPVWSGFYPIVSIDE